MPYPDDNWLTRLINSNLRVIARTAYRGSEARPPLRRKTKEEREREVQNRLNQGAPVQNNNAYARESTRNTYDYYSPSTAEEMKKNRTTYSQKVEEERKRQRRGSTMRGAVISTPGEPIDPEVLYRATHHIPFDDELMQRLKLNSDGRPDLDAIGDGSYIAPNYMQLSAYNAINNQEAGLRRDAYIKNYEEDNAWYQPESIRNTLGYINPVWSAANLFVNPADESLVRRLSKFGTSMLPLGISNMMRGSATGLTASNMAARSAPTTGQFLKQAAIDFPFMYAGGKAIDAGIRATTPYDSWAQGISDMTGWPEWLSEFTNPGMAFGPNAARGLAGSIADGSVEKTVENAASWRPWVPKNSNRYYRVVGDYGNPIGDAYRSGVIRGPLANPEFQLPSYEGINVLDNPDAIGEGMLRGFDYPMFSKGKPWQGSTGNTSTSKPAIIRSKDVTGPIEWEQVSHKGHEGVYKPNYLGNPNGAPAEYFEYYTPAKYWGYFKHDFPTTNTAVRDLFPVGNPQTRVRLGDVEINNPQLAYRQGNDIGRTYMKYRNVDNSMAQHQIEDNISQVLQKSGYQRQEPLLDKEIAGGTYDPIEGVEGPYGSFAFQEVPMYSKGFLWYGAPRIDQTLKEGDLTSGLLTTMADDRFLVGSNKATPYKRNGKGIIRDGEATSVTDNGGRLVPSDTDNFGYNLDDIEAYTFVPNYGYAKVVQKPSTINLIPKITSENASSITNAQWDSAYFATIRNGNMKEAQRLRDLHFNAKAPYSKYKGHLYHNTNTPFNAFDPEFIGTKTDSGYYGEGFYFTPNKVDANNALGPIQKDVYVNLEDPRELTATDYTSGPLLGNDGAIVKNGASGWITLDGAPPVNPNEIMEAVVNNPKKIKSADVVTYDNNGKIIPLSQRDNFGLNDIRFGLAPFIGLGAASYLYGNSNTSDNNIQ